MGRRIGRSNKTVLFKDGYDIEIQTHCEAWVVVLFRCIGHLRTLFGPVYRCAMLSAARNVAFPLQRSHVTRLGSIAIIP
jgi:hypothetical protein